MGELLLEVALEIGPGLGASRVNALVASAELTLASDIREGVLVSLEEVVEKVLVDFVVFYLDYRFVVFGVIEDGVESARGETPFQDFAEVSGSFLQREDLARLPVDCFLADEDFFLAGGHRFI